MTTIIGQSIMMLNSLSIATMHHDVWETVMMLHDAHPWISTESDLNQVLETFKHQTNSKVRRQQQQQLPKINKEHKSQPVTQQLTEQREQHKGLM